MEVKIAQLFCQFSLKGWLLHIVSELLGHRICWVQPYIRAYPVSATGVLPHQLPEDSRHFKRTKTQPSKVCMSSALIPGHWGISKVLCHLKLTLREQERGGESKWVGSKTHTVIHTFSLYPWVIEEPEAELTDWHSQLFVCVRVVILTICFNLIAISYHITMSFYCVLCNFFSYCIFACLWIYCTCWMCLEPNSYNWKKNFRHKVKTAPP